jgi:uncharacterized heparinase superfamily protein
MSRSPLGQMEAIALLVRLIACYRATRRDPPAALEAILQVMVPPLLALAHGDGSLGSWGGWAVSAAMSRLDRGLGRAHAAPARCAAMGVSARGAGKSMLQFDAAPPPWRAMRARAAPRRWRLN